MYCVHIIWIIRTLTIYDDKKIFLINIFKWLYCYYGYSDGSECQIGEEYMCLQDRVSHGERKIIKWKLYSCFSTDILMEAILSAGEDVI